MKQAVKTIMIIIILLAGNLCLHAQCRDLDVKELAKLLVQEKKAGMQDDVPFLNLFTKSGLTASQERKHYEGETYSKDYNDCFGKIYKMVVTMRTRNEDGKSHRVIDIQLGEHGTMWWMVVTLKSFGLKVTMGEDDMFHMDMKGKGLYAGTGINSISLGY